MAGSNEGAGSEAALPLRENRDGFWVGAVHYSANPDFDYESACKGMSPEAIRTELEIDWLSGTGLPVYPTFRRQVHVASGPIEFWPSQPLYAAWDWGLEPACGLSTINPLGQWCLLPSFHPEAREFEGIYSFASHVAEHLIRRYAEPHGISLADLELIHYGDPAGRAATPQPGQRANEKLSAFQVLNQGIRLYIGDDDDGKPVYDTKPGWGWHVIPGAVSVTERLEAVKGRLGAMLDGLPAMIIDPREEFGISCFLGGYHYKQFSDGRFDRQPAKDHASHLMNCLDGDTLVETDRGHIPIRKVTPQDKVWTRSGWRQVSASWCSGERAVCEVSFSDGRTLICTADHRIWADEQWIQASQLRYNNICHERKSPTTDWSTTATPNPKTERTEFTSDGGSAEPIAVCTLLFGKRRMARCRADGRSIIGMGTLFTTLWRTWRASRWRSIGGWMQREDRRRRKRFGSTWKRFARWRWSGIGLKKAGPGTWNTLIEYGIPCRRRVWFANTAGLAINQQPSEIGTAVLSVAPPLAGRRAWITCSGSALTAAPPSPSTRTKRLEPAPLVVLSVRELPGTRLVYDLAVEEDHEFYANGILVHNCWEYAASRLWMRPNRRRHDGEFDEDKPRRDGFRSQSSAWHRS